MSRMLLSDFMNSIFEAGYGSSVSNRRARVVRPLRRFFSVGRLMVTVIQSIENQV
jgi:hypothetical protein